MKSKTAATFLGFLAGPSLAWLASATSYRLALAALMGSFASLWIVSVPQLGFYLTAAMIPLERFGRFTDDSSLFTISLMRLVGVITVFGVALHLLATRARPRFGPQFWLYSAYVAWALFSALHSSDFEESVRAGGQLVGNLLFFYVVIALATNYRTARHGTYLWLAATALIGIYTIYDWHLGDEFTLGSPDEGLSTADRWRAVGLDRNEWESIEVIPRAIGSTTHSAVYGINLLTTIPFLFLFWRESRSIWSQSVWGLILGIVAYNILLTNTRSVFLAFAVTLCLCWMRGLVTVRWPWLVTACLAAICLLPMADLSRFQRILDPSNYTLERSATLRHRLTYWYAGMQVVRDNWLWGVGMGNENEIPQYLTEDYTAERTSVHNEYLQTLMELGVIGFLLFFTFVGWMLWDNVHSASVFREHAAWPLYRYTLACQIAMITVLLYGLQCDVFRFPLKGWWYVAAITVLLKRLSDGIERGTVDTTTVGEADAWAV